MSTRKKHVRSSKTPRAQPRPRAHLTIMKPSVDKRSVLTHPHSLASTARSHARHEHETKPKPISRLGVNCVDYSPQSPTMVLFWCNVCLATVTSKTIPNLNFQDLLRFVDHRKQGAQQISSKPYGKFSKLMNWVPLQYSRTSGSNEPNIS